MENESEILYKFFMWFRENGQKYIEVTIEEMIQIYLKQKKWQNTPPN